MSTTLQTGMQTGFANNENGWGAAVNNNFVLADAMMRRVVISKSVTAPPSTPIIGDTYIPAAGSSGAWNGFDNWLLVWNGTVWLQISPKNGWSIYVVDESTSYRHNGTAWINAATQPLSAALTGLAAVTTAADKLTYATAANTFTTMSFGSQARSFIAATDVSAQRTVLGLGTAALANTGTASGNVMLVSAFGLGGLSVDFMATVGSGGFDTAAGKCQFLRYSSSTENKPGNIGTSGTGLHMARAADGSNDTQLAFDTTGKIAGRSKTSGTWSSWFTVYTSHNPVAYNTTTATAANAVLTSTGEIQRSTSSMKYKTDVEPMWSAVANELVDQATPIFYRSLCTADNPAHSWYGLSAEQLAEIDPRFVFWKTHEYVTEGEGDDERQVLQALQTPEVEGVFYERLVVPLLLVVKELKEKVQQLEQAAAT